MAAMRSYKYPSGFGGAHDVASSERGAEGTLGRAAGTDAFRPAGNAETAPRSATRRRTGADQSDRLGVPKDSYWDLTNAPGLEVSCIHDLTMVARRDRVA